MTMNPRDVLAIIIGLGLVLWGMITIFGLAWRGKSISEAGAEFFVAIGGVLAGAVATYLAARNGNNK